MATKIDLQIQILTKIKTLKIYKNLKTIKKLPENSPKGSD